MKSDAAVVSSGLRQYRSAAPSHDFLAQDGGAPEAIVADTRAQMTAYGTVHGCDAGYVAHAEVDGALAGTAVPASLVFHT